MRDKATKKALRDTQLALVQLYEFVQAEFERERYPITHYIVDNDAASAALVAVKVIG